MSVRRTTPTVVRWTKEEITAVRERAAQCRLTTARYVRECALGAIPKTARHAEAHALLRELARSGTDLKQLAAEASGHDRFPAEERIQAVLALHLAAIRQLVDESHA